jgi:hypothetical protein
MDEGRQLDIEVREWDRNSFTIEAVMDPRFEQQLTHGIVSLLILRHNGRQVQQLRNVRVERWVHTSKGLGLKPLSRILSVRLHY